MKYIIVDLEATCWKSREGRKNEIIEIGAVCVDDNKEIIGEFVQIVQPLLNPVLSEFCISLTTITQEMVDEGVDFKTALSQFTEWINSYEDDYLVCSWGHYDRVQFTNDCYLHNLSTDWLQNHISLKHQYGKIKLLRRPVGMKVALKKEQIKLEGVHHRGIDDAKNIAKIFIKYFDSWKPNETK